MTDLCLLSGNLLSTNGKRGFGEPGFDWFVYSGRNFFGHATLLIAAEVRRLRPFFEAWGFPGGEQRYLRVVEAAILSIHDGFGLSVHGLLQDLLLATLFTF